MNLSSFFKKYTKQSKKGFTLVEMITVIIILSIISTATIGIVISVQTTVRDTSKVVTDQHKAGQIERFMRNDLESAGQIDVMYTVSNTNGALPDLGARTVLANDEYIYYDATNKQIFFMVYREKVEGATTTIEPKCNIIIDDVVDAKITLCPVDPNDTDADNMPYKVLYKFTTKPYREGEYKGSTFTYSGGVIVGNSRVGDTDTFVAAKALADPSDPASNPNVASIHWHAVDDTEADMSDVSNDLCLFFHSTQSQSTDTDTP